MAVPRPKGWNGAWPPKGGPYKGAHPGLTGSKPDPAVKHPHPVKPPKGAPSGYFTPTTPAAAASQGAPQVKTPHSPKSVKIPSVKVSGPKLLHTDPLDIITDSKKRQALISVTKQADQHERDKEARTYRNKVAMPKIAEKHLIVKPNGKLKMHTVVQPTRQLGPKEVHHIRRQAEDRTLHWAANQGVSDQEVLNERYKHEQAKGTKRYIKQHVDHEEVQRPLIKTSPEALQRDLDKLAARVQGVREGKAPKAARQARHVIQAEHIAAGGALPDQYEYAPGYDEKYLRRKGTRHVITQGPIARGYALREGREAADHTIGETVGALAHTTVENTFGKITPSYSRDGVSFQYTPPSAENMAITAATFIPIAGWAGRAAMLARLGRAGEIAAKALPAASKLEMRAVPGLGKVATEAPTFSGEVRAAAQLQKALGKVEGAKAAWKGVPSAIRSLGTATGRHAVGVNTFARLARHPALAGLAVFSTLPHQGSGYDPRIAAFAEGLAQAMNGDNYAETLKTTARVLPSLFTAPAAIAISAGETGLTREIDPLAHETASQAGFMVEMAKDLFSGDAKRVQETIQTQVGLVPLMPLPAMIRAGKRGVLDRGRTRIAERVDRGRVEDRKGLHAQEVAAAGETYIEPKRLPDRLPRTDKAGVPLTREVREKLPKPKRGPFPPEYERRAGQSRRADERAGGRRAGDRAVAAHRGEMSDVDMAYTQGKGFDMNRARTNEASFKAQKEIYKNRGTESIPQNYIFPKLLGKRIEAKKSRKLAAEAAARGSIKGEVWQHAEIQNIVKAASGSPMAERVGVTQYGNALFTASSRGIESVREAKAQRADLQDYEGTVPQGASTARMGLNTLIAHGEELFNDPTFVGALDEIYAASKRTQDVVRGHDRETRGQYLRANPTVRRLEREAGLPETLLPEEMIPDRTNELTPPSVRTREQAFDHIGVLKRQETRLRLLVKELEKDGDTAGAKYAAKQADRVALSQRRLKRSLKGLYNPKSGASLSATKSEPWTGPMEAKFVELSKERHARFKMGTPAPYLKSMMPTEIPTRGVSMVTNAKLPKISEGILASTGIESMRFEDQLASSFAEVAMRYSSNEAIFSALTTFNRPINGKAWLSYAEWRRAEQAHQVPHGIVGVPAQVMTALARTDISHEAFVSLAKDILAKKDPEELERSMTAAVESLPDNAVKTDLLKIMASKKGKKLAPTDIEGFEEIARQMTFGKGGAADHAIRVLSKISSVPGRLILNSPGWVLSQVLAAGIPVAAALGGDLARAPQGLKTALHDIHQMTPEEYGAVASISGAGLNAGFLTGMSGRESLRFASDPFNKVEMLNRSKPGQKAWQLTKDLGRGELAFKANRAYESKLRLIGAAATLDSTIREWAVGVNGVRDTIAKAEESMKNMNASERLVFISKHPTLGPRFQRHMNQTLGNWTSFSSRERVAAPFLLFYPWLRYSIQWALFHFPINHPVTATIFGFLAQQNARELEKIAGGPLSSFREYAYPAVGGHVYPVGTRISPTMGAFGEVLGADNRGVAAMSAVNPVFQLPVSTIYDRDVFGAPLRGDSLPTKLGNQLWRMSPGLDRKSVV